MTNPPPSKPSPLRGLAVGLILTVILFPPARHLLFSSVAVFLGVIAGTALALLIHTFATARR